MKMIRRKGVQAMTGQTKSPLYEDIRRGLFTAGVSIGARAKAWPEHEVVEINRARIAGKSSDDIRELVRQLHEARKAVQQ